MASPSQREASVSKVAVEQLRQQMQSIFQQSLNDGVLTDILDKVRPPSQERPDRAYVRRLASRGVPEGLLCQPGDAKLSLASLPPSGARSFTSSQCEESNTSLSKEAGAAPSKVGFESLRQKIRSKFRQSVETGNLTNVLERIQPPMEAKPEQLYVRRLASRVIPQAM
jgi:hypothetical protein